jgi:hypothetical protein
MNPSKRRFPLGRLAFITTLGFLFTVLPILGPLSPVPSAWKIPGQAWAAKAKTGAYTPAPGSAEFKAILAALGKKLASTAHLKMVFGVIFLKVHNCWAWIHVLPRSPDGTQSYEDVHALLEQKAGCWQVAEIACTEEGNPNCLGAPDYFTKLMARFPGVPPDIFPK